MTTQADTSAPGGFIQLLQDCVEESGFTLRELAAKVGVSHTYLSRLMGGRRGLPADKTIAKLERALNVPSGKLFYEAERPDLPAKKVLKKECAPQLMRTLAPLSAEDLQKVQQLAEKLAKKYPQGAP